MSTFLYSPAGRLILALLYRAEKALAKEMEKRLLAYVQTGILSLRSRSLGLPAGDVPQLVQGKPVSTGAAAN